jgi:hypothetical protein
MTKLKSALAALVVALGLFGAPGAPVQAAGPDVKPPKPTAADRVLNPHAAKGGRALPGVQANRAALAGPWYSYSIAEDNQASTGMKADVEIGDPWKSSAESHTLWEQAVCDDTPVTGRNCIEVGWVKGTSCTAATGPCLFIGYWKNGVFQGWNGGADLYDYAPNTTIYAGISLNGAVGGKRHMRIQYDNGNWWIGYGTGANGSTWFDWVARVQVSGWSTPFTSGNTNQWFTEVASTTRDQTLQCTDAGKNVLPTTTAGHLTENMDLYGNVNPDDITVNVIPAVTGRGAVRVNATTARLGGPGPC